MNVDIITSLFFIVLAALAAPIISKMVPKKALPEVVVLLFLGVLIGPHALSIASESASIELIAELGLGFLFLLAGYEIDIKEFKARGGVVASFT